MEAFQVHDPEAGEASVVRSHGLWSMDGLSDLNGGPSFEAQVQGTVLWPKYSEYGMPIRP